MQCGDPAAGIVVRTYRGHFLIDLITDRHNRKRLGGDGCAVLHKASQQDALDLAVSKIPEEFLFLFIII